MLLAPVGLSRRYCWTCRNVQDSLLPCPRQHSPAPRVSSVCWENCSRRKPRFFHPHFIQCLPCLTAIQPRSLLPTPLMLSPMFGPLPMLFLEHNIPPSSAEGQSTLHLPGITLDMASLPSGSLVSRGSHGTPRLAMTTLHHHPWTKSKRAGTCTILPIVFAVPAMRATQCSWMSMWPPPNL